MEKHSSLLRKSVNYSRKKFHSRGFRSRRVKQPFIKNANVFYFRFADVFGLDLADVKTFLDEVPRVPKSAFRDLKDAELSDIESDSGSEFQYPVQPSGVQRYERFIRRRLCRRSKLGCLFLTRIFILV